MKTKLVLVTLILAFCSSTHSYADQDEDDPVYYQVHGKYNNPVYGFSIIIPGNLVAYGSAPPRPNHGIKIQLGKGREIYANAEFDSLFYGSGQAAIKGQVEDENATDFKPAKAKLGKYKAASATYLVKNKINKIIEMELIDDSPILYSVQLETDQAHLKQDEKIFDQVAASFKKTARQ